jgi:2,3-bisphosphoglycerate-independent phosphoglycerate mutase
MQTSKTILIILDGWGHGDKSKSDVIHNANTPFIDSLYTCFPNSELLTDGEKVGLPNGQMGNSEVGHFKHWCRKNC